MLAGCRHLPCFVLHIIRELSCSTPELAAPVGNMPRRKGLGYRSSQANGRQRERGWGTLLEAEARKEPWSTRVDGLVLAAVPVALTVVPLKADSCCALGFA